MKITIGSHVLTALRTNSPLVALETALVTHGLPQPLNLETALAMEAAVREVGAIPATIGVLAGQLVIGLTETELALLAKAESPMKVAIRELPAALAGNGSGGTTVSATAYLAHRYGLAVLSTGGIGGVHPGASYSFDISSDLTILARTPITVISSGAKAILDLGLTLEYLETQGVTVAGYRTNSFPAFYAAESPYQLTLRVDSPEEVAKLALARDELGLHSALLISNPAPKTLEISWEELKVDIAQIEAEIKAEGISGQNVTPQMLRRLNSASPYTLAVNSALLIENARLGAEIAQAICAERKGYGG